MIVAGAAKLYLGRDRGAAAWLRRAVETNRNYPLAHFFLASTLAQSRPDERGTSAMKSTAHTMRRLPIQRSTSSPNTCFILALVICVALCTQVDDFLICLTCSPVD